MPLSNSIANVFSFGSKETLHDDGHGKKFSFADLLIAILINLAIYSIFKVIPNNDNTSIILKIAFIQLMLFTNLGVILLFLALLAYIMEFQFIPSKSFKL
jgi:hypothetical protein